MDEQIKWYEVKKRNNIRTPHLEMKVIRFINPFFLIDLANELN